jgi:hypothetical protein
MRVLSIVLLGAALWAAEPAFAEPPHRPAHRPAHAREMLAQGCMSLSEAVAMVRRKYGGRVVSAETRVSGNREVHIIKVLTEEGRVVTERIPGCPVRSG